ncbi:family 10 glycosylhydrolase [Mucilaginibacter sp. BJC16-A38]|uniref:family 10 glycosylhydrolase n=1 Tax=Mucilaginibacter phenanthrenivorans TaxID=1234842 RepID=UPI002157B604|nr:family 10 glycosylhydrolase [Mucilaginibacter phenanthrenivorans]MCR8559677.1 family 10 glycosylhydrolase [Mucilaginibacter phenanthrenivorans]
MNKRDFLKAGLVAGAAAALPLGNVAAKPVAAKKHPKFKNWVWTNPNQKDTDEEINTRFAGFKAGGITGIFFESDSERHFRAAKAHGIEAHRWIWTFNRAELVSVHPDWYSKSRNGDSCADKPPYVNYYRWLCPSRPEVQQYLEQTVKDILDKEYVDGIHLDYVRYCDVVLPVNLWANYKIEQIKELPEYDFCYCNVCRAKFKEQYGTDLSDIQFPEASLSWRLFRYGNIIRVVNSISAIAHQHKKQITAAVFPTPEIARRNVRQDWTNFHLDGVCPMIYHGFYKEKVGWIGDAVAEGVHFLAGEFPLYAGLYISDFKNDDEIKQGIQLALKNGAHGVSLFGNITPSILEILKGEMVGVNS